MAKLQNLTRDKRFTLFFMAQGQQEKGWFLPFLNHADPHIKRAAGEELNALEKLSPKAFQTYTDADAPKVQINDTANVQPATVAMGLMWLKALAYTIGVKYVVPDGVSGLSLGNVTAMGPAGVLRSKEDHYRFVNNRGIIFNPQEELLRVIGFRDTVKSILSGDGQYCVKTILGLGKPINVGELDKLLEGSGFLVTHIYADDTVSVSGPASSRIFADGPGSSKLEDKIRKTLQDKLQGMKVHSADADVFYLCFHHKDQLQPNARLLRVLTRNDNIRESALTGEHVFHDTYDGVVLITNDGKTRTGGTGIMHYFWGSHVTDPCNVKDSLKAMGRVGDTAFGLGDVNFVAKTALRNGYVPSFYVVSSEAELAAAAQRLEGLLKYRQPEAVPSAETRRVPARRLATA